MRPTEAPERIWLQRGQAADPTECTLSHVSTDGTGDVEYVRADLAALKFAQTFVPETVSVRTDNQGNWCGVDDSGYPTTEVFSITDCPVCDQRPHDPDCPDSFAFADKIMPTGSNEPDGPYRVYSMRDYNHLSPLSLIELRYLDEMFDIEVANTIGQPIRLVLTQKPHPANGPMSNEPDNESPKSDPDYREISLIQSRRIGDAALDPLDKWDNEALQRMVVSLRHDVDTLLRFIEFMDFYK